MHLAELYGKLLRETGLAPRTVGHVHRVVHRALGHARQWAVVQENVAELVEPPPVTPVRSAFSGPTTSSSS